MSGEDNSDDVPPTRTGPSVEDAGRSRPGIGPAPLRADNQPENLGGKNGIIYPLGYKLIEKILRKIDLRFDYDNDGDIHLTMFLDEAADAAEAKARVHFWFIIAGGDKNVLSMKAYVKQTIPQSEWARAIHGCNDYHSKGPYGYGVLAINPGKSEARLKFQSALMLTEGTIQAILYDFVRCSTAGAYQFFKKAFDEDWYTPHPGQTVGVGEEISSRRVQAQKLPPLSKELIEWALDKIGYDKHVRDDNDDVALLIRFQDSEIDSCVWFRINKETEYRLDAKCFFKTRIPESEWIRLLMFL